MYRAFPYALKACELGSFDACVNVSVMYKKGEGVNQVTFLLTSIKNILFKKYQKPETDNILILKY